LDLGGIDRAKEEYRDALGTTFLDILVQDLRYAFRTMLGNRAFTLVAVLSLALAIGANTAVFSLVDVLMLRDLPVARPNELVEVGRATQGSLGNLSYPLYERVRDHNTVFDGVIAVSNVTVQATVADAAVQPFGRFVSENFFAVLGMPPGLGRMLSAADEPMVTVITHRLWQRGFGGDTAVVGKTLMIRGLPFKIVGVLPLSFEGLIVGRPDDFYIPMTSEPRLTRVSLLNNPASNWLKVVGRVKTTVSRDVARANVDVIFAAYIEENVSRIADASRQREIRSWRLVIESAKTGLAGPRQEFSQPVLLLMGAVSLVLLIACANVAGLLLTRGMARKREIGIRLAIGASRRRLVQQLLTEAAALGIIGGAIGFALANWGTRIIALFIADGDPAISFDITPDARVLLFTCIISIGSALLAGLVPAFRAAQTNVTPAMQQDGRGLSRSKPLTLWSRALTSAQVALSLLLLTGASLLVTSLRNLHQFDAGFDRDNVLLIGLNPAGGGYAGERRLDYYRQVLERIRNIPAVQAAGLSLITPIGGGAVDLSFAVEGRPREPGAVVYVNDVSDGYFAAMGTRVLMGHEFRPLDRSGSTAVAVVNEALSRRYFKNENPIGRRVQVGNRGTIEIVGVVANAKYLTLREEDYPTVYVNAFQSAEAWGLTLAVQTAGDPDTLAPTIRREVQAVAPAVPIASGSSFASVIDRSLVKERLVTRILGFFAVLAVLLTSVGLYGVLAYSVTRRTSEFGIRIALGAPRRAVLWAVVRESWMLVATGVVMGVPAALSFTRPLSSLLFGVTPTDTWILSGAIVCLFAVAAVAAAQPAWRALRVDPVVALRHE
jgi:predicted permease